jgi:hypothetical protein
LEWGTLTQTNFCRNSIVVQTKSDIVMNYVLTISAPAARIKEGQAHKTKLTNCIQGMPEKSAPANSRGDKPARLAPLRKRQQLRLSWLPLTKSCGRRPGTPGLSFGRKPIEKHWLF